MPSQDPFLTLTLDSQKNRRPFRTLNKTSNKIRAFDNSIGMPSPGILIQDLTIYKYSVIQNTFIYIGKM